MLINSVLLPVTYPDSISSSQTVKLEEKEDRSRSTTIRNTLDLMGQLLRPRLQVIFLVPATIPLSICAVVSQSLRSPAVSGRP